LDIPIAALETIAGFDDMPAATTMQRQSSIADGDFCDDSVIEAPCDLPDTAVLTCSLRAG